MRILIVLGALCLLACPAKPEPAEPTAPPAPAAPQAPAAPPSWSPDAVPEAHRPALARADGAIGQLKQKLMPQLLGAMEKGGPEEAVKVCSDVAQQLTTGVWKDSGVAVGRTSHKLRNPKNAPAAWAKPHVEAAAGKKASEVGAVVVKLDEGIAVLRPIPTGATCLNCHGADVAEPVRTHLAEKYPDDQATGFAEGDLRGWFWAVAGASP